MTDNPAPGAATFEAWWQEQLKYTLWASQTNSEHALVIFNAGRRAALAEAAAVCDRIAANCAMFEPKDWTGGRTAAECRDAIKRLEER